MSETWQIFNIEELEIVSFQCPECKTQIVFSAKQELVGQSTRMCPGCNKEIPEAGSLLSIYRQLYQKGVGKMTLRARIA